MFKGQRKAERVYQENVSYSCIKTQAELEKNIDGLINQKIILE